jgi:hypothetical protein
MSATKEGVRYAKARRAQLPLTADSGQRTESRSNILAFLAANGPQRPLEREQIASEEA